MKKSEAVEFEALRNEVATLTGNIDTLTTKVDQVFSSIEETKSGLHNSDVTLRKIGVYMVNEGKISWRMGLDRDVTTMSLFLISASLPLFALSQTLKSSNHFAEISSLYLLLGLASTVVSIVRYRKTRKMLRADST